MAVMTEIMMGRTCESAPVNYTRMSACAKKKKKHDIAYLEQNDNQRDYKGF